MSKNAKYSRRIAVKLGAVSSFSLLLSGCKMPPSGTTIQPAPLGSIVDEANRRQEDNAEAAKFVVYAHEFELNKPLRSSEWAPAEPLDGGESRSPRTVNSVHPKGIRLNEYGVEHVQRLAKSILGGSPHQVIVERSESSKWQKTRHQFPVHFNAKLDQERRMVVVEALAAMGIQNAEQLVAIAPAFATGLHAQEAINAYQQGRTGSGGAAVGGRGGGSGGGIGGRGGF